MKDCIYISRYYDNAKYGNEIFSETDFKLFYYIHQFFHEIGHCIYQNNVTSEYSTAEESFCDEFSYELIIKIYGNGIVDELCRIYDFYKPELNAEKGYINPKNYNTSSLEKLLNKYKIYYINFDIQIMTVDYKFKNIVSNSIKILNEMIPNLGIKKVFLCNAYNYNNNFENHYKGLKEKCIISLTDYENNMQNIEDLELIYERNEGWNNV